MFRTSASTYRNGFKLYYEHVEQVGQYPPYDQLIKIPPQVPKLVSGAPFYPKNRQFFEVFQIG